MNKKFKNKTIPSRAHPLVQKIFGEMNHQQMTYAQLSSKSKVAVKVLERWRSGVMPQIQTLELVMEALNLELKVELKT